MKSHLKFVRYLLMLLFIVATPLMAEEKTFTFFVTSDSHYEAVEKVERNDRNRLTIARMNELPSGSWLGLPAPADSR